MSQSPTAADWRLPKRVAYVVNHSFPYSSDGYAVRTHEVARALSAHGHEVLVINRPGRPWDIEGFPADAAVQTEQVIDGVRYIFLPSKSEPVVSLRSRLRMAERALMEAFEIFRPGAVMAVSNWENAEPALYAARRLGAPFFYEQRGFWEMTRAALEPGYDQTDDYKRIRENELRIGQAAQAVFTLNRAMRDELVRRGLDAGKIHLVPNGVSEPGPVAAGVNRASIGCSSKYLLGYVGSLSAYEGSGDLLRLLAALRKQDIDVDLMIAGSSAPKGLIGSCYEAPAEDGLRAEAASLGLQGHVHFVPQMAQSRIGAYYRLLDAVVMPRRRSVMTEMVAPLKPYAAAAYGLPVFMTDMPPLDEIAKDIHGSLFPEGDMDALAAMIAQSLTRGDHPARKAALDPQVRWTKRVAPMVQQLQAVASATPPLAKALGLAAPVAPVATPAPVASAPQPAAPAAAPEPKPRFNTRILPRVALHVLPKDERIAVVGPGAHLAGGRIIPLSRASLLSELATGTPGRFVIDWAGLQADPGEWEGLWSIENMRLNRQIMDAARIAMDRGWRLQVAGPILRSRAPLFRTVSAAFEEILPDGGVEYQEAAQ